MLTIFIFVVTLALFPIFMDLVKERRFGMAIAFSSVSLIVWVSVTMFYVQHGTLL